MFFNTIETIPQDDGWVQVIQSSDLEYILKGWIDCNILLLGDHRAKLCTHLQKRGCCGVLLKGWRGHHYIIERIGNSFRLYEKLTIANQAKIFPLAIPTEDIEPVEN